MKILTNTNGGWLRKTTAVGMVPLLLFQVLIALLFVPDTLKASTEIRREMAWEELRDVLEGEKNVTVVLSEGGAVRSDRVTIFSDSIHLGRITKATNWKRYPWGSETSIARDSVREIRLENMRGYARLGGTVLGATGAFGLTLLVAHGTNWYIDGRHGNLLLATAVGAPLGGAVLGYRLGRRWDHETTIITVVD